MGPITPYGVISGTSSGVGKIEISYNIRLMPYTANLTKEDINLEVIGDNSPYNFDYSIETVYN